MTAPAFSAAVRSSAFALRRASSARMAADFSTFFSFALRAASVIFSASLTALAAAFFSSALRRASSALMAAVFSASSALGAASLASLTRLAMASSAGLSSSAARFLAPRCSAQHYMQELVVIRPRNRYCLRRYME